MVIPPYTIHQLLLTSEEQLNDEYDRTYMYITPACLSSFGFNEYSLLEPIELAKENKRYHFNIADSDDFERIFQCFMGIYQNSKREFREKEMLNRAHIIEAVTLLNKHNLLDKKPREATHENPLIDKVLSYINEHYKEDLSLEQLAGHFYLNKFTLAKLFKEQTDRTVHNYIILKRISMAKQKITEGMLPSAVYQDVGFRDYSTFYRAFLKMEKISPKGFARFCSDKKDNQNKPVICPSSFTSMPSAAGTFGNPGIVIIVPVMATTNPAPAETQTSRMWNGKPSGLPRIVLSSDIDYWFFALHTGIEPNPSDSIRAICCFAAGSMITSPAP